MTSQTYIFLFNNTATAVSFPSFFHKNNKYLSCAKEWTGRLWGCLSRGGVCPAGYLPGWGGVYPGGVFPGGVSARHLPPCEQNDWQTPVKILPSSSSFQFFLSWCHINSRVTNSIFKKTRLSCLPLVLISWPHVGKIDSAFSHYAHRLIYHHKLKNNSGWRDQYSWCSTFRRNKFPQTCIGGSKGGARDAYPPEGPNSSIFMQFSGKKLKNNSTFGSWILDPPLTSVENDQIDNCYVPGRRSFCRFLCSAGGRKVPES